MWANAQRDMAALPNIGGALCSTPQGFLRIEFLSVVYSCVLIFSKFCRITDPGAVQIGRSFVHCCTSSRVTGLLTQPAS